MPSPKKTVRWAPNTIHPAEEDISTPELTFVSSSPASSAGAITPPSPFYPPRPLPRIMVHIHNILRFPTHGYTAKPALAWDLTLPAAAATASYDQRPLVPPILAEAATDPPLPAITLMCSALPWPIVINSAHPRVGVTVADMLNGVYFYLRLPVSEAEFHTLPSQARAEVTMSFKNRYRRIRNDVDYEREKSKGVKRIDFLMGRVQWAGLSSSKAGPDVWVLNIA